MGTVKIFVDYPDCIESHTKLKGILADFYPSEKSKINTVLAAYDMGIIEGIQAAPVLDDFLKGRYVKALCSNYGIEVKIAKEAIDFWFVEYGVYVLKKAYAIKEGDQQDIDTKNSTNRKKKQSIRKVGQNTSNKKSSSRPEKNGFNSQRNKTYKFSDYTIEIPTYWKSERKFRDGIQRYAETNGKVAMLRIAAGKEDDENYPVTFEGLMSDNDNMIMVLERGLFNKITEYEVIDTGVFKGILYKGTIFQAGLGGYGEQICFASEKTRCWCSVLVCQSDNTEYSYIDDFRKMIMSIRRVED